MIRISVCMMRESERHAPSLASYNTLSSLVSMRSMMSMSRGGELASKAKRVETGHHVGLGWKQRRAHSMKGRIVGEVSLSMLTHDMSDVRGNRQ